MLLSGLAFTVMGAVVNVIGLYVIYQDNGSGRSITIATLLVIGALLFFAIAGSIAGKSETQWKISISLRTSAILIIIFGVIFVIINKY